MVETRRARSLPIWASTAVIAVALGAAAFVVHWYFTTGPSGAEVVVLDRGPEDGIKPLVAGRSWRVQSGNNGLKVTKDADGQFQVVLYFIHYDFLTPEQFTVLNDGRRIAADPALAEDLGLSTGQRDELRTQVKRGFDLEIPGSDRKRLADLFQDYDAAAPAARDARERDLLVSLDESGDRATAGARAATTDASTRIKSLLTAEQWKKFEQMGL